MPSWTPDMIKNSFFGELPGPAAFMAWAENPFQYATAR